MKAEESKKKKSTEPLNPDDSYLIIRAEGSNILAKKAWIHTFTNLPTQSKLKLQKEIEELNKSFDNGKR